MLASWHIRHLWPAAGCDQNALGAVGLAVDLDPLRADQPGVAFEQGNAAVDQQFAVDAIEAIDFAILVGDQCGPVKTGLTQRPAEPFGMIEIFGKMRSVDQQLLGTQPTLTQVPPR